MIEAESIKYNLQNLPQLVFENCAFKFLCPSPSNYETLLGRPMCFNSD